MDVQVRARDKDSLAEFLGWFSIGLGTAQVMAPRMMCSLIGAGRDGVAPRMMRMFGARELIQGTAILVRPRPTAWLWSRVAGDAIDLAMLGLIAVKNDRLRTALAISSVVAVTVPDVYESRFMMRRTGPVRSARLIRKAVTLDRPRGDVETAWRDQTTLTGAIEAAGGRIIFADAPGDRGTELIVEFEHDPPGGDLGAALEKATGRDLATRLADDLRRFKQRVETGEVVASDSVPHGHLMHEQLRQPAARPMAGAAR
jgi:hypothetical protein